MKKKIVTWSLLLCVASIWGIIFYRIYSAVNEDEADRPVVLLQRRVKVLALENHLKDTVVLGVDYRNPFSNTGMSVADDSEPAKVSEKYVPQTQTKSAAEEVQWPSVKYKGYTSNMESKKTISLMEVNGVKISLVEGQSVDGLKLVENHEDRIKVSYRNQIKYIRLD